MEKRNFVTSKRSPDESAVDDMIASAAERFRGAKGGPCSGTKEAESFVKKASAEDEKSDSAE